MAVPKKRKSKQRTRQIKAGRPIKAVHIPHKCPNCSGPCLSHRVCTACGYYNGRVLSLKRVA